MVKTTVRLILFILLFISFSANAGYVSFVRGGITAHFEDPLGELCHEYRNSGVIYNQTHMYRIFGQRLGLTFIKGENSICKPVYGWAGSFRIYRGRVFEMVGTLGYYQFELEDWGNGTPGFYWTISKDTHIVPIVGLELNFVLLRWWRFMIKNINLITPKISHHSLALELTF